MFLQLWFIGWVSDTYGLGAHLCTCMREGHGRDHVAVPGGLYKGHLVSSPPQLLSLRLTVHGADSHPRHPVRTTHDNNDLWGR